MRGWRVALALEEGGRAVNAHWLMFVVRSAGAGKIKRESADLPAIAYTLFKDTGGIVGRHVPLAAHDVVDVLAPPGGVGTGLACAEAELGVADKVLGRVLGMERER